MYLETDCLEGHDKKIPTLCCQVNIELGPKEVDCWAGNLGECRLCHPSWPIKSTFPFAGEDIASMPDMTAEEYPT